MAKLKNFFSNLFKYENQEPYTFSLSEKTDENDLNEKTNNSSSTSTSDTLKNKEPKKVFSNLDVNLEHIKVKYNLMINSDINIREFTLTARGKQYNAFILYIDGLTDTKTINDFVLEPLMLKNTANSFDGDQDRVIREAVTNNITVRKVKKFDLTDYIYSNLIPQNSVNKVTEFDDIVKSVNMGNCILFVDTIDTAFDIDAKGFEKRSISTPQNEVVIRGSQEGFTEALRTNTSILRRLVNNENLIIENISVGEISKTVCSVCYMKNIVNDDLVSEVKYRLNNLNIDFLLSSGQLEQLIEDNGKYSLPQMIASERPDKAANYLLEGRVVIIVNGSPYCLIVPGLFFDFIASPEDINLKYQFANLIKIVRIFALVIAILLPGLYIATTNFHQELIPTELLFAIISSRESVPFPIIFEILIMEISFELIREAGLRVPNPIGPTIGIIGALIIGQAAVDASIVGPILIIVVAITGISSFAIPDFSFSFHFRVMRFIYLLLGFFLGFVGISIGIFIYLTILFSMSSFGVPYLSPFIPITKINNKGFLLSPSWKRETRSDFLNTKRLKKQKHISMAWKHQRK